MISKWILGCLIVIVGSTFSNFGVNLQKYAHMKRKRVPIKERPNLVRSPWWAIGILSVMFGALLDFIALLFAPQSLVSPLGSTTLIANVVFAKLLLNEKTTRTDRWATFGVLSGMILATYAAGRPGEDHSLGEMIQLLYRPTFLVYLAIMGTLCSGILLTIFFTKKRATSVRQLRNSRVIPVGYASVAGIIGAQTVLLAKMTGQMILETITGEYVHPHKHFATYAILVAFVVTIFVQIHLQNLGFKDYDALLIFPIFQISWTVASTVGGLIVFEEYQQLNTDQTGMFALALVVIMIGVYFLAQHEMQQVMGLTKLKAACLAIQFCMRLRRSSTSCEPEEINNDPTPFVSTVASPTSRKLSYGWLLLGPETGLLNSKLVHDQTQVNQDIVSI